MNTTYQKSKECEGQDFAQKLHHNIGLFQEDFLAAQTRNFKLEKGNPYKSFHFQYLEFKMNFL